MMAAILLASGCSGPEDRRWAAAPSFESVGDIAAARVDLGEGPSVDVYSFPTPAGPGVQTRLKDLSDHGQAALIEALRSPKVKAADLKKALAGALEGGDDTAPGGDRTKLQRSIVINVAKGFGALPGDRLMSTVVLVRPLDGAFRFVGYKIAATDTKVQNIAHIDDKFETTGTAGFTPGSGGLQVANVSGTVAKTSEATADIGQQYENLGIDITQDGLKVTRESERGLDVVGNTIVAVTLAPPVGALSAQAYLGSSPKMFDAAKPLRAAKGSLDVKPLSYLAACPLRVKARLIYRLRRIDAGREYYSEGKQRVTLVDGATPWATYTLVDASETQPDLYQLVVDSGPNAGQAVEAVTPAAGQRRLLFEDRSAAGTVAAWMARSRATFVGKERIGLNGGGDPIRYPTTFSPERTTLNCAVGLAPG
jgi:hypothetical protein